MSASHCHSSPSNPTRSSKFNGYQIKGLFPTGSRGLGMLEVRSVIRDPPPTAITTAWNSIFTNCHHREKQLTGEKVTKIKAYTVLTLFLFRLLIPTYAKYITSKSNNQNHKALQLQYKHYFYHILLLTSIYSQLQPGKMGWRRDKNFKTLALALELLTIKWKRQIQ